MSFVKAWVPVPPTLSVSLSTDILRAGEELVVQVSTTNALYTVLRTDEGKEYVGDPVYTFHVRFYVNQLRRAWIEVTACGIWENTSKEVYVRLRFSMSSFPQDAQETYYNSSDYARGYDMGEQRFYDLRGSWDVVWEFMKFGARYNQSIYNALYNGLGLKASFAIEALLIWAKEYFNHFYQPKDTIFTAYEIMQNFTGFNGEKDNFTSYKPGTMYECASMAAFISGIGLVMGLPARMVSLSDYDILPQEFEYQHMFAEIYGYSINGNNGWFLIDPGHYNNWSDYSVLSSYTNKTVVKQIYANNDGNVTRLWIIWGINSTGWGADVVSKDQQTSWVSETSQRSWKDAPYKIRYINNPWGIHTIS